jgi:hypothetical protein
VYPAIPDAQEPSLGSRLSDATLNVLWRLTPARSGAMESLRTPARPHPRLVAPRSPVYEAFEDTQSFTATLVTAGDEDRRHAHAYPSDHRNVQVTGPQGGRSA